MTRLRGIELSLPMQLLQAREAAMARFRPMLREHGLTEQQWRVLRVLAANEGVDSSELAKRCYLLAPSLTRILQALESQNLVQRIADPKDQRRALNSLTRKGRARFAQVGPDAEALYTSIEQRFGRAKLAQLYNLLSDLTQALDGPA